MGYVEFVHLIQRQWIERVQYQKIPLGRKRNEFCLEFLIGVQAALIALDADLDLTGLMVLVSVRGSQALEDWTPV